MANHFILTILCVSSVLSSITIRRTGWLDRVVAYYKNRFYDDLKKAPLVKIKARIERPPPGYIDSTQWDYKSVLRLLTLIRKSEDAIGVRRAIKRIFQNSRRSMSILESLKAIPSLAKNHPNDFYYASAEYYADLAQDDRILLKNSDIIVITNPVEARLPSAQISVQLLKEILENRAHAARYMTSTSKIIVWLPISSSNDTFTQGLTTASDVKGTGGGGDKRGNTTGDIATTVAAGQSSDGFLAGISGCLEHNTLISSVRSYHQLGMLFC